MHLGLENFVSLSYFLSSHFFLLLKIYFFSFLLLAFQPFTFLCNRTHPKLFEFELFKASYDFYYDQTNAVT